MPTGKIVVISESRGSEKELVSAFRSDEWRITEVGYNDYVTSVGMESPDCVIICVTSEHHESLYDHINSIKKLDDNLPVVVVSDGGEVADVVQIMRSGAHDFYKKPVDIERFKLSVVNAIRVYDLTKRVYLLENQMGWKTRFDSIIGHSSKMQEIFQLISTVAKSNATALIMGESGTGKELVARAIHNNSPRSKHPFIDINCGAIPRELLENELFGHEKGSYTGADRRYIGSCERANKGTLFLDEICEMDPSLQVKILRLLQERSFTRVGGTEKLTADIRFVAATNRDIHKEVEEGRFREDLYFRLNVVPVVIPPLRDRVEDIPLLAKYFLEKCSEKNEKIFVDVAPDALECLVNYDWPGNVRELENVIERVVVLYNDSQVKVKYLPPALQQKSSPHKGEQTARVSNIIMEGQKVIPLELVEKYAIEAALQKCVGNVTEAAKQLKIGQATLYRKIRQYGLRARSSN